MAAGKKQVLMAVYEILRQYSDAGHPLSIGQMGDMLAGFYGIHAERKSISRNIRLLKELGYDLVAGANIAGFLKVADAMLAYGLV